MSRIEDRVKAIVIPSGNPELNMQRMQTAIRVNGERELNAPYIVSGIGPDMNAALFENPEGRGLDFHRDMYEYMMRNTQGIMGVDILSIDSVGNILNTFPPNLSGRYVIVSYPIHLRRFKRIVKKAKKEGKVSQNLELEYVPTSRFSSPKQITYEIARTVLGPLRKMVKGVLRKRH